MSLSKKDQEWIIQQLQTARQIMPTPVSVPLPANEGVPKPQETQPKNTMPPPDTVEMPVVREQYEGDPKLGSVASEPKHFGLSFLEKRDLRANPTTSYLATMLHKNGTVDHFVIKTGENCFFYKKKYYHLNKNLVWYDVNSNQSRLIYFEDFVEPVGMQAHIDGDRAWMKVTPEMLKPYIEMEYVKVLSESDALSKWLKMAVYLMVANLIFTAVMAISMLIQTGIFQNLLPGK